MHIHLSAQTRGFTVFSNRLVQNRALSYTARGLLCDLLSRPDGWSEDGRRMADSSTLVVQTRKSRLQIILRFCACRTYP